MLDVTPRIRVLTREQKTTIHDQALAILGNTGIMVEDPAAVKLFETALGRESADGRVRISRELVDEALSSAPSRIPVFDRLGNPCFELDGSGNRDAVFGVGVTNLHFQEPETIVPFARRHLASAMALGHRLDGFDFISTPGVIQDLSPETADLFGILEMMAGTTKPLVMLISDPASYKPALDLCAHLSGDLAGRPFLIPYVNPITPLVLNAETTAKMDGAIDRGLPLIFSNYGMSGATCPITPAGTLALLTAELLAGLVYGQLRKPGTPMILGSLPAGFDMKAAGSFYSPQTLLLNLACAEMTAHYGVPHCGTSGSCNGWGADLLSATTLVINHFTSCNGSVGMVPFVGGSFDSLVFSPELVVYADDVITQSRRFADGFSLDEEHVGFSDIDTIGPGGNFLLSGLTGKHFRESQFSSRIWPYLSLEKWRDQGEPGAESVLREKTLELLNNPVYPEDRADILARGEAFIAGIRGDIRQ